jgi:hypothetical protein
MNEQSIDEEQPPVSESGGSPGESLAHQSTQELQRADFEPATAEIPVEPYLTADTGIHPDDADDEWPQQQARRGVRLPVLTATMIALAVLAAGFWGGAAVEKHHASTASSSASSALSSLASRFAAARGAGTGSSGFAGVGSSGGAGSATAGLVTGVEGNTLYVTDSSGKLVKVQVGASATVTRTAKSSLAGLQTGDTVIVQGTSGSSGTVTATSVRATAAGVTTGGFGGGGLFGGGAGAGSGGGAGLGSGGG